MTETAVTISQRLTDHHLLAESLNLVAARGPELIAAFYDRLFADHPEYRRMFPADMDHQHDKLLKAIVAVVTHYDRPEALAPALTAMGQSHTGITADQYDAVGAALLTTLAEFAGAAWSTAYGNAWARAYGWVAAEMLAAGEHVDAGPPPVGMSAGAWGRWVRQAAQQIRAMGHE